jgi:hypothetical protein
VDPQWVIYVTRLRDTHTMKVGTVSRKVKENCIKWTILGALYKLLEISGTSNVGFARFWWQRPVHGKDSTHLLQSREERIKFERWTVHAGSQFGQCNVRCILQLMEYGHNRPT